nr:enoyl-CoA hydratase-related protein [Paracoccus saliphilus]
MVFNWIGLISCFGPHLDHHVCGRCRTRNGMMLLAQPVSAQQAVDWGPIWQSLPDGDFVDVLSASAGALTHGPTGAYLSIRQTAAASFGHDMAAQLASEVRLQGQARHSADFQEGVNPFLKKRPPTFTGR